MDRLVREPWIPCSFHNPPPPLLDNTATTAMAPFDPTLPSTRLVQQWIRRQQPLVVVLHQGCCLEGRLLWQDPVALALQLRDGQRSGAAPAPERCPYPPGGGESGDGNRKEADCGWSNAVS